MQEEKNKKVWEEVFKDDISKIEEEKQLKKKEEEKGQYMVKLDLQLHSFFFAFFCISALAKGKINTTTNGIIIKGRYTATSYIIAYGNDDKNADVKAE